MKIVARESVETIIRERVTFDEVGEVPEKPNATWVWQMGGNECMDLDILAYYADEGLVTLTPTDDPLVYILTAEYHE